MFQFANSEPKFAPGELVRHRKYDYRGVIVAVDPRCQADHQWYMSNRSQPDQNQPWYHVLVDGCATTTYAAESNLTADKSGEPVDHPLVQEFFTGFCQGAYIRNGQTWQGW